MFWTSHRNLRLLTLVVMAAFCIGQRAIAQKQFASDMELPLSAEQTADAANLKPLFDQMRQVAERQDPESRSRFLLLQQQVLMQVTSASLQVDAAAGQIDSEIAEIRELENYMSGRRDTKVDRLNLAGIGIGGIAGTASSALGLTVHDKTAAITGIIAGAATAGLSLAGFLVSKHGGENELMVQSNMLAKVFAHPSDANNVYPPVVVAFMNSIAPNDVDGLSRQDRLIRSWVELGKIPEPDTLKGKEKINHLTSLPGEKIKQSISDLDDRQAMLYDLRVRLNYIKQDLAILLAAVPTIGLSPQEAAGGQAPH